MSMNKITHIVVHYSATFEDQNLTVKDIDKMHKARGWSGVGYHYVIRRDGVVEKGRPDNQVGAHVGGQNSGKIGICAIGGVNRKTGPDVGVDNRTAAQIKSQVALIKSLLIKHPKAKVVGHRDLAPTQCPGFDVIPWWKSIMTGTAEFKPVTKVSTAVTKDLPAGPTKDTEVVTVPASDKPTVIVLPETKPNPPASPTVVPRTKKGFAVLAAIIASFIAAAVKYFGG